MIRTLDSGSLRAAALVLAGVAVTAVVVVLARPDPLERAREAATQGQAGEAARLYEDYLSDHPGDHDVRLEFAERLAHTSPDRALQLLEEIPETSPRYPVALQRAAGLHLVLHRDEPAKAALLKLEQSGREGFAVQLALAEIAYREGDFEEALRRAARARDQKPEHIPLYLLIADSLNGLGRPAAMVEPLQSVLERQPDHYNARWNLAYAYRHAGRPDEAEQHIRWCLERDQADVAAWRLLAQIQRDQGDGEAALNAVQQALSLDSEDIESRILEAQLLVSQNEPERAYRRLRSLEAVAPDNRQLLALLARAATLSGQTDEAARLRQRLAEQIEREINR